MVNYSAIETGSKLGSLGHDPLIIFSIVGAILAIGFIVAIVVALLGK